ncbi:hypothetical protein TVAG_414500 [Trichomonas vaginalis G3]|uniref:Uncharacterized protein n=1 Tax=Trichomonas vaginalis (strain ATCC PRA-98 / G3) TaxID=412133 RepID=A2FDR9_TRIV3|nr:S1-P1 nuclease family [Trichomonas vaginalis G3]EAX96969.1 hypothetical protein TVAG_414500 [Trichomonas vaginalis G3]KAI5521367.1 S1-P1 nuclease family [Trichomonas vaginalis G3]|eukprot:XP_001309899.1 hypothetical protein [Trichomonas vaginalis G3]
MLFCAFTTFSRSWWGHTHAIIAQNAQKFLSTKQINHINRIISNGGFGQTNIVHVASWPDDLLANKVPSMAEWHYSDQPYIPFDNFSFPYPKPTYNVTSYIRDAWEILHDPTTTDMWAWTFHIRNLIHFVGDIHTPHHNVGRFTNELPDGDMGGNLYFLTCEWGDACKNIHFFWDSCILAFPIYYINYPIYASDLVKNASLIEDEFPTKDFDDLTTVDVFKWSSESYEIASTLGYQTPEQQKPSEEYIQKARHAAKRRVAMAGYRLGHMLKELAEGGLMPEFPNEKLNARTIIVWIIDGALLLGVLVYVILILRISTRYNNTGLISSSTNL